MVDINKQTNKQNWVWRHSFLAQYVFNYVCILFIYFPSFHASPWKPEIHFIWCVCVCGFPAPPLLSSPPPPPRISLAGVRSVSRWFSAASLEQVFNMASLASGSLSLSLFTCLLLTAFLREGKTWKFTLRVFASEGDEVLRESRCDSEVKKLRARETL